MDERRAELLRRLVAGPERIAEVADRLEVAGRAGGAGDGDGGGGPWSARQNVAHLVLIERLVFQARLDQLAAGGIPAWTWSELGTAEGPDVATLDAALASFAAARAATVAHVTALDDAGWRRYGHHATFGRLDVAGLLEVIVDHDDQHATDIAALSGRSRDDQGDGDG